MERSQNADTFWWHWLCLDCMKAKPPWLSETIPWICYERSFSEFYLSIWIQLVFNQRLQLFVQSPQPYLLILPEETKCVFQTFWSRNKWISEFYRTNPQELKCWSIFYVNYLLRYQFIMQHQPIVKRVNSTPKWVHRPYQPLSAPYHCCLYKPQAARWKAATPEQLTGAHLYLDIA